KRFNLCEVPKMSAVLTMSPSSPVSTIWMRWVLANAVPQVLLILAIMAAAWLGSWKFAGAGLDQLATFARTIKVSSFIPTVLGLLAIHAVVSSYWRGAVLRRLVPGLSMVRWCAIGLVFSAVMLAFAGAGMSSGFIASKLAELAARGKPPSVE